MKILIIVNFVKCLSVGENPVMDQLGVCGFLQAMEWNAYNNEAFFS